MFEALAVFRDCFLPDVADGELLGLSVIRRMHALASQGHLKDISRELAHDYQRNSCSTLALPELSVAVSAAGVGDRALSSAAESGVDLDYVSCRRSANEHASRLNDPRTAETSNMSSVLAPARLQRLEQLESELASLNHARRRLAVDDDLGPGNAAWNAARYSAVTGPTMDLDPGLGDVKQPVDHVWNDYNVADGDLNTCVSPCLSSSFRDVAALQRRQLCGGSVFTASTAVITSCLQSSPLTSWSHRAPSDVVVSSLARLANSRFHGSVADNGDGSPSTWCVSSAINARTSTVTDDANNRHVEGQSAAFPRTPAKRELPSPSPDSAADCSVTSVNGTSRLDSNYTLGM